MTDSKDVLAARSLDEVVGRNVREIREDRGVTQKDLAGRLRGAGWTIDPTALTRIENGTRSVRIAQLQQLAAALEVGVDDLLRDDIRRIEDLRDDAHRSLMRARANLVDALKAVDSVVNQSAAFGGAAALKEVGIREVIEPEGYPEWVRDRVAGWVASDKAPRARLMPKPPFRGATPEQLAAIAHALIADLTETYGWTEERGSDWGGGVFGDLVKPEIERPDWIGFVS